MQLGSFSDYDKYEEAGKPEDDSVCYLEVPIPVGTKVEVRSRGEWVTGTVLTYTKLGALITESILRDEMNNPDTWSDPWTMMPKVLTLSLYEQSRGQGYIGGAKWKLDIIALIQSVQLRN